MFGSRKTPSRDTPGSFPILASTDFQRDADIDDSPIRRSRKDLWKSLRCIVPTTSSSQREDGQFMVPAYDVDKLEIPNSDFIEAFSNDDLRALWKWKHQHTHSEKAGDGVVLQSEPPSGESTSMWPASLDVDDAFIVFSDSTEDEFSILHSLPPTDIIDCEQVLMDVAHPTAKKTSPAVTDRTCPESDDEWSEKRSAYSGSSISDSSQLVDQIKRVTADEYFRAHQQGSPLKELPSVAKARSKLQQRSGRPPRAESKTRKGPKIVDFNPVAFNATGDPAADKDSTKRVEPSTDNQHHRVEKTIPALLARIRKLEALLEAKGISVCSDEEGPSESCFVDEAGQPVTKRGWVAPSDHSFSSMANSNGKSHDNSDFSPIRWGNSQGEDDETKYTSQRSAATNNDGSVKIAALDKNRQKPFCKNTWALDKQITKPSSPELRRKKGKQGNGESRDRRSRADDGRGNETKPSLPPVRPPSKEAWDQSSQDGSGAEGGGLDRDTLSRFSRVSAWVDYTCGGGFME